MILYNHFMEFIGFGILSLYDAGYLCVVIFKIMKNLFLIYQPIIFSITSEVNSAYFLYLPISLFLVIYSKRRSKVWHSFIYFFSLSRDISSCSILIYNFFSSYHFDIVIHLAAQTGVRNSVSNPDIYIENNIIGFQNVLKICKSHNINKLIF